MAAIERSFEFSLSDEEKRYLHELVRLSILQGLKQRAGGKDAAQLPPPISKTLEEKLGAFVTLKIDGNLRGCIGNVVGNAPLHKTIANMAQSAAFEDPRFPPLSLDEFERIETEISVLSPLEPCPDSERIEVGRHGLLIRKGPSSGLLLPQVPVEWGWDRDTFLRHTCRKAGMGADCWTDPETQIFWFEAEVF